MSYVVLLHIARGPDSVCRSSSCARCARRNTKGVTFLAAEILIILPDEKHILPMLIGFNDLLKRHYENHLMRKVSSLNKVYIPDLKKKTPKKPLWISAGGEYPNILPVRGKSPITAVE